MFTFYMDAHPLRFYKVSGRFQKFPLSLPLQLKRIGALAEMLDFRDQFHCFLTEADAELLGGDRMLVCHCCWGGSGDSGGEDHQHQQRSGFSS